MPPQYFKGPAYWLLAESPLTATERLVFVAICSCDNGTRTAWPSVLFLAGRCALSERAVQRALRGLAKAGAIRVTVRSVKGGPKTSNLYTILDPSDPATGDTVTPINGRRVTKTTATGDKRWPQRVPQSHPITTSITMSNSSSPLELETLPDGSQRLGSVVYRDRSKVV